MARVRFARLVAQEIRTNPGAPKAEPGTVATSASSRSNSDQLSVAVDRVVAESFPNERPRVE